MCYDGRDLARLDAWALRRNIGVVLQGEKLFGGSIYDNIAISAPGLSLDDAWAAAELAGEADDIRAMPMSMHTMIPEGGGGASGGLAAQAWMMDATCSTESSQSPFSHSPITAIMPCMKNAIR